MSSKESITPVKCPKCQEILTKTSRRYICNCGFKCKISEFENISLPWDQMVLIDEYWFLSLERLPTLISKEYERLKDLFRKKKFYGTIFQIKDIFELILKYPVLTAINDIYFKSEKSEEDEKLFGKLLQKANLSFGDWQNLAKHIKDSFEVEEKLKEDIKHIDKKYEESAIVNWRNKEIAHGALKFDNNKAFQEDLEKKLKILKTIFEKIHWGYEIEKHSKDSSPFFRKESDTTYIFDSYIQRRKKVHMLDYHQGKRRDESYEKLTGLFNQIAKNSFNNESAEYRYRSHNSEKELEKILTPKNIEKPLFLREWLDTNLKNGGIFLLQMEKGMGKSTFADWFTKERRKNGFFIFLYHINSINKYKKEEFIAALNWSLIEFYPAQIPIVFDMDISKDEFTKRINKVIQEYMDIDKMLFIIDAIEETPLSEKKLMELLPRDNKAFKGDINFLYITRCDNELPDTSKEFIKSISFDAKLEIKRDNEEYKKTLRKYLKDFNDETAKKLLQLSEERFLYLDILKELQKRDINIGETHKSIAEKYLKFLENRYDEKSFRYIKRILGVIFFSKEPLSLKEISYLLGEESVSYKFLAYFSDIRSLLSFDHTQDRLIVSPLHIDTIQFFHSYLKEENKELTDEWKERVESIQDVDELDTTRYLDAYLFAYHGVSNFLYAEIAGKYAHLIYKDEKSSNRVLSFSQKMVDNALSVYEQKQPRDKENEWGMLLLAKGEMLSWQKQKRDAKKYLKKAIQKLKEGSSEQIKAKLLYSDALMGYLDKEAKEIAMEVIEETTDSLFLYQANLLLWRYFEKRDIDKALDYAFECEQYYKKLDKKQKDSTSYEYQGEIYTRLQKPQDAKESFAQRVTYLQKLEKVGRLGDKNDLAMAYHNLGASQFGLREFENAKENYIKAIEIFKELKDKGELRDENYLANTYLDLGLSQNNLKEFKDAKKNCVKALEIYEKLQDRGEIRDENFLAMAYHGLGFSQNNLNKFKDARESYKKAIEIFEELKDRGEIRDENFLAMAYHGLGNSQNFLREFKDAKENCVKALEIYEKLQDREELRDENFLAIAYHDLGFSQSELGEFKDARESYKKAIKIYEKLQDRGELRYDNCMSVYLHLGNSQYDLGEFKDARESYKKAIKMIEELKEMEEIIHENYLAITYVGLGNSQYDLGEFENAKENYIKALEIYEKLKDKGELRDENDLVMAYIFLIKTLSHTSSLTPYINVEAILPPEIKKEIFEIFEKLKQLKVSLKVRGVLSKEVYQNYEIIFENIILKHKIYVDNS